MSEFPAHANLDLDALMPFYEGVDLSVPGTTSHLIDERTGQQYLLLTETASYPEAAPDDMLDDLLLPVRTNADGQRFIALGTEYETLGAMIARAAEAGRASEAMNDAIVLFAEMGGWLSDIATVDGQLPANLRCRQILVMQEGEWRGIKFLPPLTVDPVEDENYSRPDRKMMLTQQMLHSCRVGLSGRQQRDILPVLFKAFMERFDLTELRPSEKLEAAS